MVGRIGGASSSVYESVNSDQTAYPRLLVLPSQRERHTAYLWSLVQDTHDPS